MEPPTTWSVAAVGGGRRRRTTTVRSVAMVAAPSVPILDDWTATAVGRDCDGAPSKSETVV